MNREVKKKFDSYPDNIRKKLELIRELILDVAKEKELGIVEETLKWDEPSYIVKTGSTIRLGWKPKYPDQYAIYFNCKTKLVDTFKEIYGEMYKFEGNRAIIFHKSGPIHRKSLKHCIELSLKYKKIRNLPLLGA